MSRWQKLSVLLALFALTVGLATAQTVRNNKLSESDLKSATSETRSAGGAGAELIYATRLDAVQKGVFDSLVVVYGKPGAGGGKEVSAVVVRAGKRLPLAMDQSGRALPEGVAFSRLGVRYEEGKAPLLRMMGMSGNQQHYVDYRFGGTSFALENKGAMNVAR